MRVVISDFESLLCFARRSDVLELLNLLGSWDNLRHSEIPEESLDLLKRCGFIDQGVDPSLTVVGRLALDSIREYNFWVARGRSLHGENSNPLLRSDHYKGKCILEIGTGFGCNLLSLYLAGVTNIQGIEPVEVYRQFSALFAEIEGVPLPIIHGTRAESTGLASKSFDLVLMYSTHQYTDIRRVIDESLRITKPGGEIQIIGPCLERALGSRIRFILKGFPERFRGKLRLVLNTYSYELFNSRLLSIKSSPYTTSNPVYCAPEYLMRWASETSFDSTGQHVGPVGTDQFLRFFKR